MDRRSKKIILKALKIALGSSFAIFLAHEFHLNHEISAGTITLLTIVSTKWETVKLSAYRIVTLLFTVVMTWVFFAHIRNEWIAYGAFIFLLVVVCEALGWGAVISVNSVIAAHFLGDMDFHLSTVANEVSLVLIGISIAIVLNLFHDNTNSKKELVSHMRQTEERMRSILTQIAAYLSNQDTKGDVWQELRGLDQDIRQYVRDACDYQNNTFSSHPGYYIDYFEMRLQQCGVLRNLHYEMKKIRSVPAQAQIVADYILYMKDYVVETNDPKEQIAYLKQVLEERKNRELPSDWEAFDSGAILYHILIDLEDFLYYKKRFVDGLDEKKLRIYWKQGAGTRPPV